MKEKTIYQAFDGAIFSDSYKCVRYEKLVRRWGQTKEQLSRPKEKRIVPLRISPVSANHERLTDYFHEMNWTDENWERAGSPELFLERMDVLQELAANMASRPES